MTVRSARFDNWAAQFLAAHNRATVLHVGCGLDTRVFRLDPGSGVEWYDIDYPNVISIAKQLYPGATTTIWCPARPPIRRGWRRPRRTGQHYYWLKA